MKIIKITILALISLLVISSLGGYWCLKKLMKPPYNVVHITGQPGDLNIQWFDDVNREAMFLPVMLPDVPDTFYMQFDVGAVYSVLYRPALNSIENRYGVLPSELSDYIKNWKMDLGRLSIHYDSIRNLNFGKPIDWNKSDEMKIIGTIGADFVEKTKMIIDFKKSKINFFFDEIDSIKTHPDLTDFEFKDRKVLIKTKLDGETKTLMWDTGASAYDLITSESQWREMAKNPSLVMPKESNQLNRKLKVFTDSSEVLFSIGKQKLPLYTVTYIEGFPWYIKLAFNFSGMEGMIGNNIFRNQVIYLDAENEKFILF